MTSRNGSTRQRLAEDGLELSHGVVRPNKAKGGPRKGRQLKQKEWRRPVEQHKHHNHQYHEKYLQQNMGRAPPPWQAHFNYDISRKPTPRKINWNGQHEYTQPPQPRPYHIMYGYKVHTSDKRAQHPITYRPSMDVDKPPLDHGSVQGFKNLRSNEQL